MYFMETMLVPRFMDTNSLNFSAKGCTIFKVTIYKSYVYLWIRRTKIIYVHIDEAEDEATVHKGEAFLKKREDSLLDVGEKKEWWGMKKKIILTLKNLIKEQTKQVIDLPVTRQRI